ncbi:MAG: leucine-rich repeat protein, partial [Oscillospiraceae bacterium]
MKKKLKIKGLSILMAILMVATIIPMGAISSFAVTSGDYDYSVISETNKTAEITWYNGAGGDITIPSKIDGYTVTGISRTAFVRCAGLKSVTIPDSITNIDFSDVQFFSCTDLTAIIVSEGNTAYSSVDGVIYSKDKKQLFICPEGKSGEVTVPTGVTSIGIGAFYGCALLTSIAIPDSVTSIDFGAFYGCTNLTSIKIPNGVTKINSQLFSGCTGLKDVTIPNGVTIIDDFAFNDCTNLTSITIPNSVTSIGSAAFFNCTSLKDIIIPNSVISIGAGAFAGCTGLKSVTIGNSVTSIGDNAFEGCTGLMNLIIPNSVTSIATRAFASCTGLTSVTIPNSVISIGVGAFAGCTGFTSITIPDSVTSIGDMAFGYYSDYEKLPEFTIKGTKGSLAESYATANGFKFVELSLKLGDVTGDGRVTSGDAIAVLRAEAQLRTLTAEEFTAA